MNRVGASPLLRGMVPEAEGYHPTLSSAPTLQMKEWESRGRGNAGTRKQSREEEIQDPHLSSSLLLTW